MADAVIEAVKRIHTRWKKGVTDCLIFDESFATLDPETLHQALQCVLERAPTLLVIAHP